MATAAVISSEQQVIADASVASTALGDQLALLDLKASSYYSMNPVAGMIWTQLATAQTPAGLASLVREQFEVGDADVDADVAALLADLLRLKLIRFVDA